MDRLLDTIDRLYAAAMGEIDLATALAFAADTLESAAATLEIHNVPGRELVHFESVRIDRSNVARYQRDFAYNPRIAFVLKFAEGMIGFDQLFTTEREMDRDPFCQELLAPSHLRYFLSAQTPMLDRRYIALMSFQQLDRVGGLDERRLAVMRRIEPHISRALRLYWNRIRDDIDTDRLDRLLAAYDLTPCERRLAAALMLGEALPRHAERTRRSLNTVHTHYRRLKDKLDCSTQAELLARLHTLDTGSGLA